MRKMPIGIQTFENIITGDFVYVDKTAWAYRLANEGVYYFLGRPRRFGKSLLLSTLRAYFEGKRELFRGLAIETLEKDWTNYPVLHIDLSTASHKSIDDLKADLNAILSKLEAQWGVDGRDISPPTRFYELIRNVCEKSGRRVVVLVDDCDVPIWRSMEEGGASAEINDTLTGFLGVLKGADRWLRFVLLTGAKRFSDVGMLSGDLNMLEDISMSEAYSGVCGITERELEENFKPELAALAEKNDMTYGEAVAEMKKRYDGYRFAKQGEDMYNPFSVLNTLKSREFAYYWFQTGTPTFLIEQIKNADFDPLRFAEGVTIHARSIDDYRIGGGNPVPLLYQSGYLTIVNYDDALDRYTLGFPNEEVRYGFLEELLPYYTYKPPGQDFFVDYFIDDLQAGDADGFMKRMKSLFANIPYDLNEEHERYYQLVFYLVCTLIGQYVQAELHSHRGRADMVVSVKDAVYVFEFKLSGTAEEALAQIDDRGYAIPYDAGDRRVVKIGAAFDKNARNISRWLVSDGC